MMQALMWDCNYWQWHPMLPLVEHQHQWITSLWCACFVRIDHLLTTSVRSSSNSFLLKGLDYPHNDQVKVSSFIMISGRPHQHDILLYVRFSRSHHLNKFAEQEQAQISCAEVLINALPVLFQPYHSSWTSECRNKSLHNLDSSALFSIWISFPSSWT